MSQSVGFRPVVARGLLLAVVAACATNPVTGRRELSLVSESQEVAMGLEAAKAASAQMGVYSDSQLQGYVGSLGLPMARASERPALPWSFTVIDDPVVNAFALPGGPVFVTRGILAHMNSEAQLVSVLGHEIGHITAKHSVSQMSRAQLTQIAFVGAMIVKPELQRFGDLGSQALGLMFMKFGRDDETQADELGFRYMTQQLYDPAEMAAMFRTLDRTSGGSDETPEWLSTHPNPGNRVARTQERIAAWSRPAGALKVNREPFLRRLDGMVFGEDPRQGYFQQSTFLHPTLKFRFDFPGGWRFQNQPQQVVGVSQQQDAIVVLSSAGTTSPSQAAAQFLGQQGIRSLGTSNSPINGLPASVGQFTAQTEQALLAGYVAFIQLDGTTYRLLAYTDQQRVGSYDGVFRQTIGSFQRLTDPRALSVKPQRVRLVQLPTAMTMSQFQQQYPSVIAIEELTLINGAGAATTSFPAGTWLKRVIVE
ncbi:MAG: M48 family metalloprotease [Gemmatimonadaceae bacterium]